MPDTSTRTLEPRIHLLLTVLLIGGLGIAWVYVEGINQREHDASIRGRVSDHLGDLRAKLQSHLYYNIRVTEGLQSFITTHPDLDQETWARAVKPLLGRQSQLRNIAGAPDLIIRLMYPVEGNEKAIGLDYRKNAAQFAAADLARTTGALVLAGPLELVQGGTGLITRIPVFVDDESGKEQRFWGLISAVIDADRLFSAAGLDDPSLEIEVAIRGTDATGAEGPVFFGRAGIFGDEPITRPIALPYGEWQMAAIPTSGWVQRPDNLWRLRALMLAVCLSIVIPVWMMGRLIAELHVARQAANQASEAKSNFLSSMSHEIRTPMNGMLGMAQLLGETRLDAEQRRCVEVINESGEALIQVINDILDFSRLEAGRVEIVRRPFALGDLVRSVVELLGTQAQERRVDLRVEAIDEHAGDFRGDPGRIRQILINLIGNAIKFTRDGSVRVRVAIEDPDSQPHQIVRFEVEDTGIGIEQQKIDHLFERFAQADESVATEYGGTGLGLSISKALVDAMNGVMGVESQPGEGSLFWFELPLEAFDAPQAEPSNPGSGPGSENAPALAILVAEDVLTNQTIARRALEKLGHEVEIANNGQQALEALRRRHFGLVLMDVRMPMMDGLTATRAIRAGEAGDANVPIVAMTANATGVDREACLECGMNDFVSKPFDLKELARVIAQHAGTSG